MRQTCAPALGAGASMRSCPAGDSRCWPSLLIACTLALAFSTAGPAHALGTRAAASPAKCLDGEKDSRGRSSVDDGEIAWEDETRYDDARGHAVRVWTGSGFGKVRMPADDASRIADLEWADVNTAKGQWKDVGAAWTPLPGTDSIRMNRAYLAGGRKLGTPEKRRMVAAHELGHALGFCHKSPDWYATLLAPNVRDIPPSGKPASRDRSNYRALWG
ncbi:hypothetical protein [Streptomyces sp. CAU 1734]|uniref:hypothetical protein n=1 Tax=Streptomyces sp. CAU 1734 TaxID=3140360 RepID=UPI0032619E0C